MKAVNTKPGKGPTAATLRELPEIDFSKYRIRRNMFAVRIAREGFKVLHDAPSSASLAEIPEVDFDVARLRPNKYATRVGKAASKIQYGKGRPRIGNEIGLTPPRSLRLPEPIWQALEAEARERMTTVHALLRELVVTHVSGLQESAKMRRGKHG
jgi:hypothetical protein